MQQHLLMMIKIRTETEEEYDDIIEEILKRIVENNFFVKSEKYIQKVKKMEFLEVVIGIDGVKMEKEKV